VLCNGIPQYMTPKIRRIWIANNAEDPVQSHTPGPGEALVRTRGEANQGFAGDSL
jgi:hypothetical protein